jgi:hypothetical protein
VERGDKYIRFLCYSGESSIEQFEWQKSNFKSYEMFVAVIGKFNPWTVFLKRPVTIPSMTYEELHPVLLHELGEKLHWTWII